MIVVDGWANLTEGPLYVGDVLLPMQKDTTPCRVFKFRDVPYTLNGIPISDISVRSIEGLPLPKEGVRYVVPWTVAVLVGNNRDDVFYANGLQGTKEGVRMCKSLARWRSSKGGLVT